MINPKLKILVVDDHAPDRNLTVQILNKVWPEASVSIAIDGLDALDYLFKRGMHERVSSPDLIILDLRMPQRDGLEVLQDLQEHEEWQFVPIIVFTGTVTRKDINTAYELGAVAYVHKPIDVDSYVAVIASMRAFWERVIVPSSPNIPG